MPLTTGTVECINVGDDFAFAGVREKTTLDFEAFIVWFAPSLPTASLRLLHSHWFSMLSQALSSGDSAEVQITHGTNSAFITALRLNKTT